jgi:hypothetical protein
MEANLTQEGAISVTGPAGQNWVYFGPENFEPIEGEYIFSVRAEAAQTETLMVERSQLIQFISVIMQNPLIVMAEGTLRALVQTFPVLANNELLIQELKMLGQFMVRMQAMKGGGGGGPPQQGGDPQKPPPKTSGEVTKKANQVVSR